MSCRVWFGRTGGDERPWFVAYESGAILRAGYVELRNALTIYKADGFAELPEGPKAIIEGEDLLVLNTEVFREGGA